MAEQRAPGVPRIDLAPGYSISRLIKGGWQLAGGHGVVEPGAALAHMAAHVDAGITTFDCADIYTGVEELIGAFLRTRRPGEVQVHTKCVPDLDALDRTTPAEITRLVQRSCERLRVERLDLVQLHWWDYARGDFVTAALALEALRARGMTRHIGVTNFGVPQLRLMLDARVPVVSHQLQYSLLDRRPAAGMVPLCREHGIGLLCFGALAGGFMGERWLGKPEPSGPLENRSLVKYKLIIDEAGGWDCFQSLLEVLREIAQAHGVGIGAIAIRWVLDQPGVAAVIAGARDTTHLRDSVAALGVQLTPGDHARIDALLATMRVPPGDVYELERDREGPHGRIMRYNLNVSR